MFGQSLDALKTAHALSRESYKLSYRRAELLPEDHYDQVIQALPPYKISLPSRLDTTVAVVPVVTTKKFNQMMAGKL